MDSKLIRQLPGTLWSAVVMELFERLAYYGMVMVLGIYIVDRLGVPADTFGWVYGIFTATLYFLPVLAGALADRFGYKPALTVAFATLTGGYALLGASTDFRVICAALGLIAVGGSIIKPTISGSVTRTTEAVAQLEHLILAYPGSAAVPQARRDLDAARGGIPES